MASNNSHGQAVFSRPVQMLTHSQQHERTKRPRRPYRDHARRLLWRCIAYFFLVVRDAMMLLTIYLFCLWMRGYDLMYRMKTREFPLWFDPHRNLWYGPTSISHPRPPTVISSLHTAVALLFIPIGVFLLMQLRVRSFWDANHAIWGLLKAVAVMTLLEETFKRFVARPRPYFMSACKPDGDLLHLPRSQYAPAWATIAACRGSLKPDAMQSFPSGHTGNSFAAATFLALYLNAKLKAHSNYQTNFAKQMVIVAPLIGAGLIAAGMVIDRNHHATDVLLSILLGVLCGLLAYRAQYRSLANYHNNHIPLPYRESNSFTGVFGPRNNETSETTTYGTNDGTQSNFPDKYLAVRWPFSPAEKRGPVDTKKPQPTISPTLHHSPVEMNSSDSGNRRVDVDGNSSMNAVWSMSMGQASTVIRTKNAERSSVAGSAARVDEGGRSVRDNRVVGLEAAAEMV